MQTSFKTLAVLSFLEYFINCAIFAIIIKSRIYYLYGDYHYLYTPWNLLRHKWNISMLLLKQLLLKYCHDNYRLKLGIKYVWFKINKLNKIFRLFMKQGNKIMANSWGIIAQAGQKSDGHFRNIRNCKILTVRI